MPAAAIFTAVFGCAYVLGTAALIAFSLYIAMASGGRSSAALRAERCWEDNPPSGKAFMCLAGIGLLVCLYQGAVTMLGWMPDSWGFIGEGGDWTAARSYFAGAFTFIAGFHVAQMLLNAGTRRFTEDALQVRTDGLKEILDASVDSQRLASLKRRFAERRVKLDAKMNQLYGPPKFHDPVDERRFSAEYWESREYWTLEHEIDQQLAARGRASTST